MYIFKINKSLDSSNEEFENTVNCARDCVESVLDNESLLVIVVEDTIRIDAIDKNNPIVMTLSECKKKIKGCFMGSSKNTYPEFKSIAAREVK